MRRIPLAVWLCALVGFLNAAGWSLWTPPLQSPDEPVHVYYVQYLAETGKVHGKEIELALQLST